MNTIQPDSPLLIWVKQHIQGDFRDLRLLTDRVRSLPNLSDWVPDPEIFKGTNLVLGRISNDSFRPLLELVAQSLKTDSFSKSNFAELGAAALIRPWCDEVVYILKDSSQRTPDLKATLGENILEIEVTTADEKNEQVSRRDAVAELAGKMVNLSVNGHLSVYILDSLKKDEDIEILRAASTLTLACDTAEVPDRWYIQLGEPRPNGTFEIAGKPPPWWSTQYATPASLRTSCSIEGTKIVTTSSVEVRWGLSTKSYINPLSKKVDRPQSSGKHPFLIAMDATSLPGALKWYEDYLPNYWNLWKHVSGIVIFQRATRGLDALLWEYKLFLNPYCETPLPSLFLQRSSGKEWLEHF
jgi:hypothetical protein